MKDSNNHLKKILYAALKKENRKISLTEIQKGAYMEGFFEHGLGALHRLRIRTGYPADADRLQREYPLSYLTIDERLFVRSCRGLIP